MADSPDREKERVNLKKEEKVYGKVDIGDDVYPS